MIETKWAVLVCFHGETKCVQLVSKLLLSEHLVVGVIRYSLERYPDASFPSLERQIFKQKLTMDFQNPVHFRQRVLPVGYVVNDPEIDYEIETGIRKLKA